MSILVSAMIIFWITCLFICDYIVFSVHHVNRIQQSHRLNNLLDNQQFSFYGENSFGRKIMLTARLFITISSVQFWFYHYSKWHVVMIVICNIQSCTIKSPTVDVVQTLRTIDEHEQTGENIKTGRNYHCDM